MRKRCIRVLRDVCITQPEHPRVPELLRALISRVNDEETIRVHACASLPLQSLLHTHHVVCEMCRMW